ncbi:hypothetical protein LJC04_02630 [Ruminococcaceae bacterium OttesenSCG-928-O06]|nr:hypothetical protein [Ruminococcaceae bacterium OttesenSCG-928-O06]MDL2219223.1 hypothetical protein [Ruminococcaceae bacterium OttesenSCG-928-O06]
MKRNGKNFIGYYGLPAYIRSEIDEKNLSFANEQELERYASDMRYMAQWLF